MTTRRLLTPFLLGLVALSSAPSVADTPADPAEARRALTPGELDSRLLEVTVEIDRLTLQVRRDVDNRLHRIAYEKCRVLDARLAEAVDLLLERKRREPRLGERILIDRQIEGLHDRVVEVRDMIDILRLYAQR